LPDNKSEKNKKNGTTRRKAPRINDRVIQAKSKGLPEVKREREFAGKAKKLKRFVREISREFMRSDFGKEISFCM